MLTNWKSNQLRLINDFSRLLFLINTPADFAKGIREIFSKVFTEIELFALFRYNWEDGGFAVTSSNYLNHISNINLEKGRVEKLLQGFIKVGTIECNNNSAVERKSNIMPLLNPSLKGSEILVPLYPVNEPTGLLYIFSRKTDFFDEEKVEFFRFAGNMLARTWNQINYQALQIKSHKKAELEVINQKNFMNQIFDYLPVNIFMKDDQGRYIYVNKNLEDSTGIKSKDALGKTVFDLFPEQSAKTLNDEEIEIRHTDKEKLSQHELEIDGRKRHFFTGVKSIETPGEKELLIGFSIDITQNIQANRIIDDQKKFYEQIFNAVPNYIYVKNKEGKFLLVNEAVARMFDTSLNQILLTGIAKPDNYLFDEKLNREIDARVLANGETIEYEESVVLKSGEERWYHTTKKPLPDKEGNVNILGISVDITDRKKHSDEIVKAKQAKELFLANMSHEIRTPINGIVGMVNLLEEIPATDEQKKYLTAIKISSQNLQVIINDILDLSAVETGNMKFERIGFNLKSMLSTLISSFSYASKQKGISITLHFDPYIDQVLIGDPVRLNQILSNLIGNSVKFTKRGFVKVYALKINETDGRGRFQFIIDDSGIGIAEEKIEKVFENFEQGDISINRKFGGTGLGLAIVKQLVDAQKGSIKVESKPSKGTKFTVELSFDIGTEADLSENNTATTSDDKSSKLDLSKYKLLLVEDNEVNILYTKKILQNWNCIPDEAKNGLIALEKLKDHDYDLVLMDVRMPVMDGFEASKFIRTNFKPPKSKVPIIALTANAIKGDDEKCLQAGMNDYISKPFLPDTLRTKIVSNMNLEGFTKKVAPMIKQQAVGTKSIDLTFLKEMSENDSNFIADLIQSFITQFPKDMENVWFHFQNAEYDDVANLIHKIKPSITFIGIHELKDLVVEIEDNAKKRQIDPIEDQLKLVDKICKKAIAELLDELPSYKK